MTNTLKAVRYEEVQVCESTIAAAVANDGKAYFSPRWVCKQLGISWQGQHVKIQNDPVFNSTVKEIVTVAHDGKNRSMTFLPIEHLAGWLTTIKKVPNPVTQELLTAFRREAFSVLDAWFRKGMRKEESMRQEYDIPNTLQEALREYADALDREQHALAERDEAVRTKAWIGSKREATAMNTAAIATKRANSAEMKVYELKDKLGVGMRWKTVKAIP